MAAENIDEVVDGLAGVVREAVRAGDRVGYFAALYRQVTVEVPAPAGSPRRVPTRPTTPGAGTGARAGPGSADAARADPGRRPGTGRRSGTGRWQGRGRCRPWPRPPTPRAGAGRRRPR
ncbi:hypothetical protein F9278_00845 [Streptomyces phaeolivaceus]|uniref:Uncharacterized protein n=1 Tax=Streptomyces phaeolivaceus TaxID=2653200 RepID=A0A5P8JX44_9ACTN|nr:hypothetical protein F9278_00845 [Streptomyces phaeolivaceus]